MAAKSINYYRDKLKVYLAQMNSVDLFGIRDHTFRHKAIDAQVDLLKKLQPLLKSVSASVDNRDKDGMFLELKNYNKHIEYLRKYTDEYTMENMEFINSCLPIEEQQDISIAKQVEAKKQLELVNIISGFDKFISDLCNTAPKTTAKELKEKSNYESLSLADLRLI